MKNKPQKIVICSGRRYNFKKGQELCENRGICKYFTIDYYEKAISFTKYHCIRFRYKKDFIKCNNYKIK